jgi:rRNA-processing protein FCF1
MTPHRWLLIDAHNVIHADADLRRMMDDPERARAELERLIAGRRCTTVFYDGGPGGAVRSLRRKGLAVVYCGSGEADDAIIAWIKHHAGERAAVVSDDAGLRRRCHQLRTATVDTKAFLAGLRQRTEAPVDEAPLPAHEVDQWMRVFAVGDHAPKNTSTPKRRGSLGQGADE